ncbi:DUF6702 family protein [Mariniflexile sp. AS56]|uniref:DUF6702 family protein n=1 Tax=Mariniflexile sp. AS56 TaxID=3063957 RepID=UPI0026EDF4B5|nr:DUF6702 family protein [Mariniflexile sp. AS56]MDO7173537.1 hypothetical protein [Mariniflexile sp. AS56]
MMFRKSMLVISLLITMVAQAHQPDVSTTMLVEKENNTWVLQISASLTAFQQEIRTHFAETPYKTPEEFQQMVITHIKNNLEISFNGGNKITLGKGFVKLGHETKVVFEVVGVPLDMQSVVVKNSAFKDIFKNQSALVLLKNGFNKEHFVLNDANNHTLNLEVQTNKFVEKTDSQAASFPSEYGYFLIAILLASLGVAFVIKKNNAKRISI